MAANRDVALLGRLFRSLGRASGTPDPPLKPRSFSRLVSLSMVKNEQDIIEPFIRHHSQFVDCMIILDNASVDETRAIAQNCARELSNVLVVDCPGFEYSQSERMTRLLHYCQTAFFADFVLLLDADEFLEVENREALLVALETIPPNGIGHLLWQTFVLAPGTAASAGRDPPRSMQQRRKAEIPEYHKAVLRLDGKYRPNLVIEGGNHEVSAEGATLPAVALNGVRLLHFPVRSHGQIMARGVVGWMARTAREPKARQLDDAYQWRAIFDKVASTGVGPNDADLCNQSMHYAQQRATVDWRSDVITAATRFEYSRRYSTGAYADPFSVIVRSWEQSLLPAKSLELERRCIEVGGTSNSSTACDPSRYWDNLFVDVAPFQLVAEKHRPTQVLDFGCGAGAYLQVFKQCGSVEVLGIDTLPGEATVLAEGEYLSHDLSQPLRLGRIFDLVVCVEVAQRLEPEKAAVLLDNAARHAGGVIVFSAAEPGQPGSGHINCRPISYWLECWAARGWRPDLVGSLGMRCIATLSWFRRNLVVLRRSNAAEADHASAVLTQIAAKPFIWYDQLPGIRETSLLEPLPPQPAGYSAFNIDEDGEAPSRRAN